MLNKLSFRWKLYIVYGGIITIILIIMLFLFWSYNEALSQESIHESAVETLKVTEKRLEDFFVDKDQQLKFLNILPEFRKYMKALKDEGDYRAYYIKNPEETMKVQEILLTSLIAEKIGNSISFISENYNNIYASVQGNYERTIAEDKLRSLFDIETLLKQEKNVYYLLPHRDLWRNSEREVVSVCRPVKDLFQYYGILVYDVDVRQLDELLLSESSQVSILDEKSKTIYSPGAGITTCGPELIGEIPADDCKGFLKSKDQFDYYYLKSETIGCTLIMQYDMSSFYRDQRKLIGIIFSILVASAATILVVLYFVTQQISKPLQQLKENLEAQKDLSEIHVDVTTDNNEITILGKTIEKMLHEIMQQNSNLIATKELAFNAHMNAMEAQLNPHFLYNTLSVIGTYGLEQNNMVIPQMCRELSNILRYSISYMRKTVSLKDEIENIKSYLYIMQMRYEDMLQCEWDIDESIEQSQVPKLILQPIIENCFKHGFSKIPPMWKVKIRCWKQKERWMVSIANSGEMLDQESVQLLLEEIKRIDLDNSKELYEEIEKDRKLGLRSTFLRIKMYYREDAHYDIFTEDGFTIVELGGRI